MYEIETTVNRFDWLSPTYLALTVAEGANIADGIMSMQPGLLDLVKYIERETKLESSSLRTRSSNTFFEFLF